MKLKRYSIILAIVFIIASPLTGCGQTKKTENISTETNDEIIKETESDVESEVENQKEIIEDFYHMVNSQWILENKDFSGFYYGSFEEQENKVKKTLDNYLKELSNKYLLHPEILTDTEEKAIILYEQATNMEKRNELGIQPIGDMLAEVEQVTELEGLITLYKDEKIGYFNPLFGFRVEKDSSDGSYQVGTYPKPICGQNGMLTEEQFAHYEELVKQLMIAAGYEENRAIEIAKHAVDTERKILELNFSQVNNFSRYEEKGIVYLLNSIPLIEIAREQGYLKNRVTITCAPEHLKLLQELFVEENTEALKDYFLAAIVVKSAPYLTENMSKSYETAVNALMGAEGNKADTYVGYKVVKLAMEDFLADYYMEEYVGKDMEQEIEELTEEIRCELKTKIENADWLSVQTRNYAVKKLEAMQLIVGIPEKTHDYSILTITSYEDGGNLIENILNVYINDLDFQKELLEEECEDVYYFHPLEVNATYAPGYNAFAINAAIITLDNCSQESKYEEKLAILGFTIAHEISHGFDGIGSNYTVDGKYQNWWSAEDKAAYRERINKVKHYFDGMEVTENLTLVGENVMNETYSDLSAMSICMDLLEKRENSDYRLFFETYGKYERIAVTDEFLEYLVNYDTHLPGKIRVNQIVNQMDEFYEVYSVPEDGAMYVPKEDRLQVWE